MQPAGSASSQPSLDSLSSSDGFLFSDDDSGVFVSEEGGATPGARVGHGSDSPASRWSQDGFGEVSDPARSEATAPSTLPPPASSRSSSGPGQGTEERGGRTRRENCLELQGFVRPLLDLLNGLKRGRFDRGLSSFQQSVAMDRIQRIVGVLQKPHIGEKYLPTLLQVEMMLKLWFPQVTLRPTVAPRPPHKHKDQLHIPVKVRHKAVYWSEPRLTWVHVAPIFSPPKSCPSHEGGGGAKQNGSGYILLTVPSSTSRSSPATQDSSVSSTTPFSDPAGCQNQPVDSETLNPETGRGQTPPTMTQP
uniref:Circadian associated repressor of transcription a n=1 Tax=Electrophorus electricus TaxID=8005 RepID=A0AAY5ESB4_ELEEL